MNENIERLIECAEKVFADEKHFFQHRGGYTLDPSLTTDGRCGVCYLGAAYYGCTGKLLKDCSVSSYNKLSELFDVDTGILLDVIYYSDKELWKWTEISDWLKNVSNNG